MKNLFTFLFLILSGVLYSQHNPETKITQADLTASAQSDSVALNTPAVFTVTFYENKESLFSLNQNTTYEKVLIYYMTSDYILTAQKYTDKKNNILTVNKRKIYLKDIKELGYKTGTQKAFGTYLGMGIGAVGGTIIALMGKGFDKSEDKFNPGGTESITSQVAAWTISGAILGYLIGGTTNDYKRFDLSAYTDNKRKFDEINIIVKKAAEHSGKKQK